MNWAKANVPDAAGRRWLAFRQHKNRNKDPVDLVIPILPQLESVLGASRRLARSEP
ncbi:hypothetical protein IVA79_17615 [Bradyrhizobium sp. 138]|uniref:hypothetical protein n=1 Tax=Bradyrhizobium sp. 138 TaxID=2782615 RepID=UPI001FFAFE38|nr:hypothetical protein [Bradyrhizobium sp. 138]MCK1735716.1 hypothetical protein [Bradyrhizobium sp. 138]